MESHKENCKKQNLVSLSTTEAKYCDAANAGIEVDRIHQLLNELGFPIQTSNFIYYDNKGAIQVANNWVAYRKMKHVKLHVHYLIQLVQENNVYVLYCRTFDKVVDIFTNPLP